MGKIIETVNLCHIYPGGVEALKNINLSVEEGERIAIIGQNGSGKTTLTKHFNGLLRPTYGKVLICGQDAAAKTTGELSHKVGYVFQNPAHQLFSKTVKEEIEFGLRNIGFRGSKLQERLVETLEFFELTNLADKQPLSFSSGVRKLVALASVYAMRPSVLILDEPTTGQDHPGKDKVGRMLIKMAEEGHTFIVITHDMNFVTRFVHRVIVMAEGNIIKDGTPREIFSDFSCMKKAHIEPPQVFSLARRLAGWGIRQDILNPSEMADTIAQRGMIL